MIRQIAFEKTGNKMLKGALHTHTTRSDGRVAPDEVIRLHAQNGYDFMALTDHRYYNYQNFAPDVDMLIVPGMEMDNKLPNNGGVHTFHAVCIGPSAENGNGYVQDQRFDTFPVADQFEYQSVLDDIHAHNNLTIYCHPQWSGTSSCEYDQLKGHFAMEVWNSGCVIENEFDKDAYGWDEVLRKGVRIFGVATDDGHKINHHCKGWVRVNAARDLDSILDALKRGAFYSSCGPEIYDFRVEDGKAVVECSPVKRVRFHAGYMPSRLCTAAEGETLTCGETALPEWINYIRASVVDENGKIAWTNPIFLDK